MALRETLGDLDGRIGGIRCVLSQISAIGDSKSRLFAKENGSELRLSLKEIPSNGRAKDETFGPDSAIGK